MTWTGVTLHENLSLRLQSCLDLAARAQPVAARMVPAPDASLRPGRFTC